MGALSARALEWADGACVLAPADAGAGGAYQVLGPQTPVVPGGLLGWFACGHNGTLSPNAAATHLRPHLSGYHAFMVGNPRTAR